MNFWPSLYFLRSSSRVTSTQVTHSPPNVTSFKLCICETTAQDQRTSGSESRTAGPCVEERCTCLMMLAAEILRKKE